MTSNMSLVRCRDVVEEGLVFLFVQVLLLTGTMRVFLCLDWILWRKKKKKPGKNTHAVDTTAEITWAGLYHAGKLKTPG